MFTISWNGFTEMFHTELLRTSQSLHNVVVVPLTGNQILEWKEGDIATKLVQHWREALLQ